MAQNPREIQIRELKETIEQLNETIRLLNESLRSSKERETVLQEQIDYLTRKLFGKSSEKNTQIEGQYSLFDEAENEADPNAPEPEMPLTEVKAHTRKPKAKREDQFSSLPVKEVLLRLPEDQLICPQCGSTLEEIGKEYIREEVQFIPAKMLRIRYYTVTYRCKACCEGRTGFGRGYLVKRSLPAPLMKHSPASPSTVAYVMYQKYANAMPLYRQEQDWKTQFNVELSRGTMANWIIYCAEHYLKPLYEYFHRELLKRKFLMADETRVQVLKEPGREAQTDSFMWLFRTGEDEGPQIILYGYRQTRAKYNAEDFLKGFEGYLETDGYQGYDNLPGVRRCCCWAHVRRYFFDAIPKGKMGDFSLPAVQGVEYCDKLFFYERTSADKHHTAEERHKYRLEKEKPILEAFWKWLDEQRPAKNSRMYKAVNYVLNRKPYLETYLEDGRCSFSNNLSENAIRPFTVGRKNWLFADTPKGADASAICYTMVEMAKAHGLSILAYLNYVLLNRLDSGASDKELYQLAPWNPDVKEACS